MSTQRKVLIIDDEIDLSILIKSYFIRRNVEVHLSHTIKDGLNKLLEIKPDVVFIDHNLPDGEGWRLAPVICEKLPDTFIHLMSAYHPNLPELPKGAKVSVIEKPIRLSDLDKLFIPENPTTK